LKIRTNRGRFRQIYLAADFQFRQGETQCRLTDFIRSNRTALLAPPALFPWSHYRKASEQQIAMIAQKIMDAKQT